ncbi:DUF4242 domain-containing protein [Mycolicibacter minnesotensis]
MTLYLYELTPLRLDRADADRAIKELDAVIGREGGELIEAQVTGGAHRAFVIAEFDSCQAPPVDAAALSVSEASGPHPVRLVGADLAELKAVRPAAGYLVEWDLPADLDMDTYLARKKAKSPLYANVPEVAFLRTYVREDMDKCLCFYDAPDEAAVRRAREVVTTPIDRLHRLEGEQR